MTKSLIVYFSQGGTTARVAEHIATGLRSTAHHVDLFNLKDGRPPDPTGYDLLGIGSPTYYFRPPFNVMDYLNRLPNLGEIPTFVFVLHGTYRGDSGNDIRHALDKKGTQDLGYFHCRGADHYLGYLKERYLFSPDHPTDEELAQAEAFGREVAARLAGKQYAKSENDHPTALVYRLERFLTNRWLVRQIYSKLFRVEAENCAACGDCMEQCPTGNITENKDGHPVWGCNCLLCLTCEMICPEEAITSAVDWPIFRPFMIYNVRQASGDPSLDFERVVYRQGRILKK